MRLSRHLGKMGPDVPRRGGDDMTNEVPGWSIRAVVVSVRDLDRSSAFYQDVLNVREVIRDGEVAVLSGDLIPGFSLYLRQAHRNAVHSGQALGVRAFSCDVGSFAELDRVEGRLRASGGFRSRQFLDDNKQFELVDGHDPDRLSLVFVAHETDLSLTDYRNAMARMYAIDL
jgi:catechol 2,3-dioxygenase-like lactoylglutathione lyase family enzyme